MTGEDRRWNPPSSSWDRAARPDQVVFLPFRGQLPGPGPNWALACGTHCWPTVECSQANFRALLRAVSATLSHQLCTVVAMSRPRVYDEPRVATAIRLPASLHEELQSVASEREVSVNFLVTRAVSAYLARLPPAEDEAGTETEGGRPS
jgi:hypothetical protein